MKHLRDNISAMERAEELVYQASLFVYETERDSEAKRKAELQRIREQLERLAQLRKTQERDNALNA